MMRIFYLFTFLIYASVLTAQTTADFETYDLDKGEHIDNSEPEDGFESGNIFLPNYYFPEFESWAGWAISADTNVTAPGFMNQYSAIAGSGAEGSRHFAVSSPGAQFDGTVMKLRGEAAGGVVEGLYITNNTYAYLSMLNGDAFAKKFGGETGDDPDFFRLTIQKYLDGTLQPDSVTFYLADYRFEDNSRDYIVDDWTWVDLSSLGNADSLYFTLWSSDVGQFGMNTPAYFCVDNVETGDEPTAVEEVLSIEEISVSPNPSNGSARLTFTTDRPITYSCHLFSTAGLPVWSSSERTAFGAISHALPMEDITPGVYYLKLDMQQGDSRYRHQVKVIKIR